MVSWNIKLIALIASHVKTSRNVLALLRFFLTMKQTRIVGKNQYDKASWFSKLTFWWTLPVFITGNKKTLSYEDLYEHCAADDPKKCVQHLEEKWEEAKRKSPDADFTWTIFRTYGPYNVLLSLPLLFTEIILRVGQALAVGYLTRYFAGESDLTLQDAYCCVLVLVVSTSSYSVTRSFFYQQIVRQGYNAKNAVEGLLYRKILRMSPSSTGIISSGRILNMMANDLESFFLLPADICYFYIAPIQTVVCMVILWRYIAASAITGILMLLLFIPLQGVMQQYFKRFRQQTTTLTDKRIKLMKEIISAMRLIKLYCWEKPFSEEVDGVRKIEISGLRKKAYLSGVNQAINFCGTRLILFFTLATHVLAGGTLDAETVFVTMSMFNVLTTSVTLILPTAVSELANVKIASKRVQAILSLDEPSRRRMNTGLGNGEVVMNNYSAKWDSTTEQNALTDLTYRTEGGKLVLVVGSVGSGKSCLLHALLNDIHDKSGSCDVEGTVSYCPQEAWCFGGTIRENILFGSAYDEDWFKAVIDVCGLQRDLELFPDKDQTIVGEKGYCLSGGQKARITLVRAIYRDADIYLLDDPLSAVDPAVGKHIFQNCIKGILKTKTVFLVTHQLQFLSKADDIILLEKGKILSQGSYNKLISSGVDFVSHIDSRRSSTAEPQPLEDNGIQVVISNDANENDDDESSQSGLSLLSIYWTYFRSGSGLLGVLSVIFSVIASQFLYNYSDYWLSEWSNNFEMLETNSTSGRLEHEASNLITYTSLTAVLFALAFARTVGTSVLCLRSSINLHNTIFYKLLVAQMGFFETNPMGRILNRFTRDMGFVDQRIPNSLNIVIMGLAGSIGSVVVTATVSPYLILPAIVLPAIAIPLQRIYMRSAMALTRLEAITMSPVYNHVTATFDGLSTVRALGMGPVFEKQYFHYMKDAHSSRFISKSMSRSFGFILEVATVVFVSCVALFLVVFPGGIPGGLAGLALSSSLVLTGMFQYAMREANELAMQMVSVERILEYGKLPIETESTADDVTLVVDEKHWPSSGSVMYRNVTLAYGEKKVLDDVNFVVKDGEKIGIVGRTGAGKSSLITVLFRLADYEGSIMIDGKDTKLMRRKQLRSGLSIIPQDPVLFSGSLRRNLDPFNDFQDAGIWKCLEQANLDRFVRDLPDGLNSEITEGGSNLSVGQRQLVCLTRALMRNSKLLVLDEATANVDHETDQLIQRTIKGQFKHCTVLTVAHRLNTIIDMDKVLVMDAGQVREFDEPHQLLQNKGLFYEMVMQTGNKMSTVLLERAHRASQSKLQ